MAKLADATDLGSVGVTHGGSSPLRPTLFPFVHDSFPYDRGRSWDVSIFSRFSLLMMLGFPKSIRWVVLGALLLLAPSCSIHAMDEETTKTIAALQAQMQLLMDEVRKLKTQQPTPPTSARLAPRPKRPRNHNPRRLPFPLLPLATPRFCLKTPRGLLQSQQSPPKRKSKAPWSKSSREELSLLQYQNRRD